MRVTTSIGRFLLLIGVIFILRQDGWGDFEGGILVFARDSSSSSLSPPNTTAELNGNESQSFGSSNLVTFSGYFEAGTYSVEISTEAYGYALRQSPTDPNALNDPYSDYGNPRYVTISENTNNVPVHFQFDPVITTAAIVRDGWTMEKLEDAAIEFSYEGSSGPIVKRKYPSPSTYASDWMTDAEGNFPISTILYLHDYDLTVNKNGYVPFNEINIITNAFPGDAFDLGTIFLEPEDINTNQISDLWETIFFGSGINVDPNADADGDGLSNRDEYIAGTDPTNALSCLRVDASPQIDGFTLSWDTVPGRTYRVCGTTNVCADTWVQVGGPWEASSGQYEMVWVETNLDLSWNSNYRVEVVPCWWAGTNQVLINTNRPAPPSGGGTNTWEGGWPPLPGG